MPDEVIIGLILERIAGDDAATASCSTASRARSSRPTRSTRRSSELGRKLTAALLIEVPDEEIVRRLSGRRVCVKNGHVYHVDFDPPKHEGICDRTASRSIQRDDDKPETIRQAGSRSTTSRPSR